MFQVEEIKNMAEHQVECPSCGTMLSCGDCPILIESEEINTRLYEAEVEINYLKKKIFELRESLLGFTPQLLNTLIKMVDRKDQYTHQHSLRVTELSVVIASALKLTIADLNVLKRAAKFHDIGKIWISKNILKKAGPLTDAEYDEVKQHPELGVEILSDVTALKDVLDIIHAHHERWDGKGYPRGLKGKEIPVLARIIAIADTIDAMSQDRVYRISKSREEILEELKREAGKQFDPEIIWAVIAAQIDLR